VYASQNRGLPRNIAKYQRDVILPGCQFFKTHHEKIAPWGWQFGFCHTFKLHVILQILSAPDCASVCRYFATMARRSPNCVGLPARKAHKRTTFRYDIEVNEKETRCC
jgi:hypothetical protein